VVNFVVQTASAYAAVGDAAGPGAVNGPEFAETRDALGQLISLAPDQVRELAEAANVSAEDPELPDDTSASAMWAAIAQLPASCTGTQSEECTSGLAGLRQASDASALSDEAVASLTETCDAEPYLAGSAECDTIALALLQDNGDTQLPVVQRYADRCSA